MHWVQDVSCFSLLPGEKKILACLSGWKASIKSREKRLRLEAQDNPMTYTGLVPACQTTSLVREEHGLDQRDEEREALGPREGMPGIGPTLLYGLLELFVLGLQLGKDAPATQILLQLLGNPKSP